MTKEEIEAKIAKLKEQIAKAEYETKSVTITMDELIEKMAEAFSIWLVKNNDFESFMLSITVGPLVTKNLCELVFGKED